PAKDIVAATTAGDGVGGQAAADAVVAGVAIDAGADGEAAEDDQVIAAAAADVDFPNVGDAEALAGGFAGAGVDVVQHLLEAGDLRRSRGGADRVGDGEARGLGAGVALVELELDNVVA